MIRWRTFRWAVVATLFCLASSQAGGAPDKQAPAAAAASERRVAACEGERFLDVSVVVPDALIRMRYAETRNFLGRAVYDANVCLLRESVARRLAMAAVELRTQGFRLIVWDCYRPLSVQREMWRLHPVPGEVADPATGSNHNRGAAVDVSLADLAGQPVEMPTDFDDFSRAAWRNAGGHSKAATRHRETLKHAMKQAGFSGIRREWWHYNAPAPKRYPLCDAELRAVAPLK